MHSESRPLRCLWVTREFPYPKNRGAFLYSAGLIEAFAQSGVSLSVLCAAPNEEATQTQYNATQSGIKWVLCAGTRRHKARSLTSTLPSDAYANSSRRLRDHLRATLTDGAFNAVILDHAVTGWALSVLADASSQYQTIVYVSHNFETRVRTEVASHYSRTSPLRWLMAYDARKYVRLEANICDAAQIITAITHDDKREYTKRWPDKRTLVLTPGYDEPDQALIPLGAATPRRAILVGSFDWVAKRRNLEALLDRAKTILPKRKISLQIVGRASADYARGIQKTYSYCDFRANVDDVTPYIRSARIGLIPEVLGGGFKLKALDYVFNGLPIAALDGALAGVPIKSNGCLSAVDVESLLQRVVAKFDNLDELRAQRDTAYADCRDAFNWRQRGQNLRRVIEEVTT